MRRFPWNKPSNGRYLAQIVWKTICLLLAKGGLGIKNLDQWNKAFLLKILWVVYQKKNILWSQFVWSKYLSNSKIEYAKAKAHHSPSGKVFPLLNLSFFVTSAS